MLSTRTPDPKRIGATPGPIAPASHSPERFLRLTEVIARTGLSRSTIYAFIQRGEFPSSIPLGGNSVAWLESEINQWQADRIACRKH